VGISAVSHDILALTVTSVVVLSGSALLFRRTL
jgi:hypothetical protein